MSGVASFEKRQACSVAVLVGAATLLAAEHVGGAPGILYIATGMEICGVSADGSRFFGSVGDSPVYCDAEAFARPVLVPLLPGTARGVALASSHDGQTLVGTSFTTLSGGQARAWRWSSATGLRELIGPPQFSTNCEATGISEDARVIVGGGGGIFPHLVRWQAPHWSAEDLGPITLGRYNGGRGSIISGDGTTAAFTLAMFDIQAFEAATWVESLGVVRHGFLSDQFHVSQINAMSSNGAILIGLNRPDIQSSLGTAFRWDVARGQVPLTSFFPEPAATEPTGASADAAVIVGNTSPIPPFAGLRWIPFIWRPQTGVLELEVVLEREYRIGIPANRRLLTANGISADGRIVVGSAASGTTVPFSFVARLDPFCVADVDDGSGTGTRDDGVTIDDLLLYLRWYEIGSIRADVDDGTFTGTRDAGLSIDDLLYFLARYAAGC